jgi:ubiquinone/menaquinone biosynthesis C-methylase UbiE
MNRMHNLLCSSGWWARVAEQELVPWGVKGVDLGDDVLEIGPGFGATTRVLARRLDRLSVVELDPGYCERLRNELPNGTVTVTQGDATALPYPDSRFSAVLCFTMLHHIPGRELQDRALSEFARVLQPGGVFAGTDSVGTGTLFKLIHIGDTLVLIDPDQFPSRLRGAGLSEPEVKRSNGTFRFRALKPA